MVLSRDIQKKSVETIHYKYLVECKHDTIELEVEEEDIIYNADGEWDCPLDVVLRKNNYSLDDIKEWEPTYAHFVKIENQTSTTLKTISLDGNL